MAEGTTVEYGSVRALWEIVERVGLVGVIDKVAPQRNGISIGRLVAIMAVNRCRDPMTKLQIPASRFGARLARDVPIALGLFAAAQIGASAIF